MNKAEIASYLYSLHVLMEAQESTGVTAKSRTLVDEYNKYWDLLKEAINQENTDEARKRKLIEDGRNKARNDLARDQSGGSGADRPSDWSSPRG